MVRVTITSEELLGVGVGDPMVRDVGEVLKDASCSFHVVMERMGAVSGQRVDSLGYVRSVVDCQVVEGSYNLGKGKTSVWGVLLRIGEGSIRLQWDGEPGAVGLREHAVCFEQILSEPGLTDV